MPEISTYSDAANEIAVSFDDQSNVELVAKNCKVRGKRFLFSYPVGTGNTDAILEAAIRSGKAVIDPLAIDLFLGVSEEDDEDGSGSPGLADKNFTAGEEDFRMYFKKEQDEWTKVIDLLKPLFERAKAEAPPELQSDSDYSDSEDEMNPQMNPALFREKVSELTKNAGGIIESIPSIKESIILGLIELNISEASVINNFNKSQRKTLRERIPATVVTEHSEKLLRKVIKRWCNRLTFYADDVAFIMDANFREALNSANMTPAVFGALKKYNITNAADANDAFNSEVNTSFYTEIITALKSCSGGRSNAVALFTNLMSSSVLPESDIIEISNGAAPHLTNRPRTSGALTGPTPSNNDASSVADSLNYNGKSRKVSADEASAFHYHLQKNFNALSPAASTQICQFALSFILRGSILITPEWKFKILTARSDVTQLLRGYVKNRPNSNKTFFNIEADAHAWFRSNNIDVPPVPTVQVMLQSLSEVAMTMDSALSGAVEHLYKTTYKVASKVRSIAIDQQLDQQEDILAVIDVALNTLQTVILGEQSNSQKSGPMDIEEIAETVMTPPFIQMLKTECAKRLARSHAKIHNDTKNLVEELVRANKNLNSNRKKRNRDERSSKGDQQDRARTDDPVYAAVADFRNRHVKFAYNRGQGAKFTMFKQGCCRRCIISAVLGVPCKSHHASKPGFEEIKATTVKQHFKSLADIEKHCK